MIINTNISSLVSRSNLNKANNNLNDVMQQLSSGKRINSAKDDAAGLAIATRMQSRSNGMEVAMRNANDGISMIQTAESALGSVSNILQRMRELAVQANNGTNSATDKTSIQSEIDQLVAEIGNIATKTEFNGVKLLDGSQANVTLHIGNEAGDTLDVALSNATAATLGVDALDVETNGTTTAAAITAITAALDDVSTARAEFGAFQNRLEFTIDNLSSGRTNLEASRSRIEDADMAKASSDMAKNKVLVQSGVAMLSQANQSPQMVLQLLQG